MDTCAICGAILEQHGDCPTGCTDDKMYGFAHGVAEAADMYDRGELDILQRSIESGRCDHCGSKMQKRRLCPEGCFPEDMIHEPKVLQWIKNR